MKSFVNHWGAAIVTFLLPIFLHAQDPKAILKKYLDTVSMGDVKNWEKIKSAYIESNNFFFDPSIGSNLLSSKVTFVKQYLVWPDLSLREYFEDSVLVSRFYVVKGKSFFIRGNGPPFPLRLGVYQFVPVFISQVIQKAKTIEFVGTRKFDSLDYQIRIKTKDLIWDLFINVESFRLDYNTSSEDGTLDHFTRLFDYKKIGGYWIPMSEEQINNGKVIHWSRWTKIDLNADIDPNKFVLKESTHKED